MPEPVLTVEKEASFASGLKRAQLRDLVNASSTPASILLIICLDHFGTEFFDWEPDTLRLELKDEIDADPPQVNLDKIWALVTMLTTNLFYVSLETFIPICNALSDHESSFTHFDPADAEEMAWAVTEAKLVDPASDKEEHEFSEEIKLYAGERLRSEGFVKAPRLLSWAEFKGDDESNVDQFQDDPVMFNAIWDRQQEDINGVISYVQVRLNRVMTLLKSLPLIYGSAADFFKRHESN